MSDSQDISPLPRLLHEADRFFNELYNKGLEVTGTPEAKRRRERFYNLVQFFLQCTQLDGLIAECGCWKGLSSFILCHYLRKENPSFDGEGYHVFDSFRGLSKPTDVDALSETIQTQLIEKFGCVEGAYAASLPEVKTALAAFPRIEYHDGWIPAVFDGLPEARYRFVHIDLDLYEPTRAAIEYFYPRLVDGGLMVCDDYGSVFWPGAKQAVDAFCLGSGVPYIPVSTGQAVLWKRGSAGRLRSSRIVASLRQSLVDAQMELNHVRAQAGQAQEQLQRGRGADDNARKERDEARAKLSQLSTRFAEVKADRKVETAALLAKLEQERQQRDEAKAKLSQLSTRFAEVKAERKAETAALLAKLDQERQQREAAQAEAEGHNREVRAKLSQVCEERDRAKARALHFAARLAEVKAQLRQKQGEAGEKREHPDT